MFYSAILTPVEMCGGVWTYGASKHMGAYGCPKSDCPMLASKVGFPLQSKKHSDVMHVSRIILCINA